jgi:hypothetical protein
MKINSDFIYKIFNLEIKLKKDSDKIKLSKYEEQIPMYDIYSQKIYPINKTNIHYRLIESHYRFINEEVYRWLTQLYDKYIKDDIKGPKLKYNLSVLDNYNITTLIETSYKTLYKFSPQLGLSVSICKRNSFNPFVYHLTPYYTKLELIKLGQNMNLIKSKVLPEELIDMDIHYNICKKVSFDDVSFDEIKNHHIHIMKSNMISWICYYSWTGSFLFNKYLRYSNNLPVGYKGINMIAECILTAPALERDYDIYRFIWDDSFLINLKEGEIFIDKGFLSATRDPFYSPGLNGNFGLILLKIKLPKNKKGVGLFIENFSLFPKEEEILLPPNSKLKLISRNNNFKYYHTNSEFERLINRKYEFELISEPNNEASPSMLNNKPKIIIKEYNDIKKLETSGMDRIDMIKKFLQKYAINNMIPIKYGATKYFLYYQWFDSTNTSSYERFYYNKIKDGILFFLMDSNGYPYLNMELGNELVINYLNTLYFKNNNGILHNIEDFIDLIYSIGKLFYYKNALIFNEYKSFVEFNSNYPETNHIFLAQNLYNSSLYKYLKTQTKTSTNPFITYSLGYWYLDEYFNKKVIEDIIDKVPLELKNVKNNKELLIEIIEKYFYLYPKVLSLMDRNIIKNNYTQYNIYDKMVAEGVADNFKPMDHTNDDNIDDNFKLVFRQPIRRL